LAEDGSSHVTADAALGAVPQDWAPDVSQDVQHQQLVTFVDNNPSAVKEYAPVKDLSYEQDYLPNAELGDFLERPVLIQTFVWTEGTPFIATDFRPWHLFFTNTVIKKKIDNYAFINCNLHVKAVVNASPFYYGAMLASYRPLLNHGIDNSMDTIGISYMTHSQRPHFWILPQNSSAGEICAPFFYPANWLKLTSTTDLQNMGRIDVQQVAPLLNANTVSAGSIEIQFYAWASDVKITGPTFQLQAGRTQRSRETKQDEYSMGPVERVSSTVADIAHRLSDVPVIAPFAKATEYGSRALSKIASLFGWTNVPVITDAEPVKSLPFHGFASASIAQPVEKLTLDPKNELTVDPRTTGLGADDELSISSLVQRESYLTSVTWQETAVTDDLLFISQVSPILTNPVVTAQQTIVGMTPMAMVATNFREWRGDIVYRFKAICTQYHKGRLRITWDPVANLRTNSATTQTSYTRILDVSPDMDVEVRISYLQDRMFLQVGDLSTTKFQSSGFTLDPLPAFTNGMLSVRVLNRLTSPGPSSSIAILVFARGGENLRFMNPTNPARFVPPLRTSYMQVQAGDIMNIKAAEDPDRVSEVFGGEAIMSLRTLLRRTVADTPVSFAQAPDIATNNTYVLFRHYFKKYPNMPGYHNSGSYNALSQIDGTTSLPASYAWFSAFQLIVPCFLGMRGSMMWHFNAASGGGGTTAPNRERLATQRVTRIMDQIPENSGQQVIFDAVSTTGGPNNVAALAVANEPAGSSGLSLTNQMTQAGLSVLCPHYNPLRFVSTTPSLWNRGVATDETRFETYLWTTKYNAASSNFFLRPFILEKYYSIGPDFNAFFFLNVPPLYIYSAPLTPP
jgi:hypothetical protein